MAEPSGELTPGAGSRSKSRGRMAGRRSSADARRGARPVRARAREATPVVRRRARRTGSGSAKRSTRRPSGSRSRMRCRSRAVGDWLQMPGRSRGCPYEAARALAEGDRGSAAGGPRGVPPTRRGASREGRPLAPRARRVGAARPAAFDPREPGAADRTGGRGSAAGGGRSPQRGNRRQARPLAANGRPSRLVDTQQAGSADSR